MSSFTEIIDYCLDKICGHLSDASVLLELVQGLARQLRLDTFVDPEAYTHVVPHGFNNEGVAFKRLSIAGSFILIDIDFLEEDKILKVTLSLANYDGTGESTNKEEGMDVDQGIDTDEKNIIFYGTKEKDSIEQTGQLDREDSVENILYYNLREPTLGNFPNNLKFLTILDRLSTAEKNYFYQLNKIASFLKFINGIRCTQESWEFEEGYKGNLGRVYLNDKNEGRVGILLKFWRDFRLVERELGALKEMSEYFKTYEALLTMDASPNDNLENYLGSEDVWCLGNDVDYENLQVICIGDSLLSKDISGVSSLAFCLTFNEPICLPVQLLDFLVISNWEINFGASKELELFENLKEDKEYESSTIRNTNMCLSESAIQKYVSVTKMTLSQLSVLPKLISMVRSFLLLKNLLYSCVKDLAKKKVSSRRRSMFEYAPSEADDKLKKALQLFDGLSNDEMMALNATKNAPASFLIEGDSSMDLQGFLSESDPTSDLTARRKSFQDDKSYVKVSFDEIDLSSVPYALIISVTGCIIKDKDKKVEIHERFKIVNGGIFPYSKEDSTMDNEQTFSSKFIKGLKITEDIVLTLKKILP